MRIRLLYKSKSNNYTESCMINEADKRYLKSGVMENGVVIGTEEGSPQGGNLSPLLANIYLNEFDQEFLKRDVPCIRHADHPVQILDFLHICASIKI